MSRPKRKREQDDDSPAAKKSKLDVPLNINVFMADFPSLDGPISIENDSPLPCTVLADEELFTRSHDRKPPLRATFNVTLPRQLEGKIDEKARNAPYYWLRNQYSHCVIPELGEEYDFDYDSVTFHRLRDIHNARVRIRDGNRLTSDIICSLATRWVSLREKDRPVSDGYFANGRIFIAPCLPLSEDSDALRKYFQNNYVGEISAHHYIPRSKYSVHFVGKPIMNASKEILDVDVGSVLIRNSRTGDMMHIDTGVANSRPGRAKTAAKVLRVWLKFYQKKHPKADLGFIADCMPLIPDVAKETHPRLRSIHAIVSASLFLRRRITDWGEVKAFNVRNKPTSTTMANYALQNISGWLGLPSKQPRQVKSRGNTIQNSFETNYSKGGLMGREQPAPVSQRILTAKQGAAPVYNEEEEDDAKGADAGDDEDSHNDSSDEGTVIDDELPDDKVWDEEDTVDDELAEKVSPKGATSRLPSEDPEELECDSDGIVDLDFDDGNVDLDFDEEISNAANHIAEETTAVEASDEDHSNDEMIIDEEPTNYGPANEVLSVKESDDVGGANGYDMNHNPRGFPKPWLAKWNEKKKRRLNRVR